MFSSICTFESSQNFVLLENQIAFKTTFIIDFKKDFATVVI